MITLTIALPMIYKFQWLCNEITTISHCIYNNAVWLMLCWDFVNNFHEGHPTFCCFISFVACYCREIFVYCLQHHVCLKIISHSQYTYNIDFQLECACKYTDRRRKKNENIVFDSSVPIVSGTSSN